ncbi:MAG: type II secretion system inner membrane protein GspF [Pseudomonadota bacterium]
MAAFDYEALDTAGRVRKGVISADSARQARQELSRKKLILTRLNQSNAKADDAKTSGRFERRRSISSRDLAMVTRQLATLISAAAPIEDALKTIGLQSEKPAVRQTLMQVRDRVLEGYKFSEALAQYKRIFTPLYRAMVQAGEVSGGLGQVMERLADHLERGQKLKSQVQTALTYPIFLAVTATAVVILMLVMVVPRVAEQFESLGQTLPFLTRFMIGLSEFIQAWGLAIAIVVAVLILALVQLRRRPKFRLRWDRAMLKVPVLGRLMRNLNAARLARTLSTLSASGVPLLEGLIAAQKTISNQFLNAALGDVITQVREGGALSGALRKAAVFPPLVVYMTAMGEKGGRLDEMLGKAADYLEGEFEAFTKTAISLLEPVIIIAMGAVVAMIVVAILLPILQLNTLALG